MRELWNLLLFHPLINSLIALYKVTGNLGWAIIILTVILRLAMTPLILPSLKLGKKMQELAPELAKLKEKFTGNKQGLALSQAELYKQHGANPAAGCLPQIIQLVVLIALFSALNSVLKPNGAGLVEHLNPLLYSFNRLDSDFHLSTKFLYLDLTKPDVSRVPSIPIPIPGIFLLLSAFVQLISSKMMLPVVNREKKLAQKTPQASDDAMVDAQQQMLYLFPLMTLVIGFQFPSGLVIYWFIFSAVSIIQQYYATGWGGLTPWLKKIHR
ncbi:hypothetical protein A2379_02865 [Candidatus Amesbacteria bacterium RIFOXYB1_FULL_47_13]|nr:MAG: hypothetical protein A2379_02865 [Candidatus Amesbacteria bacterium RIFOXYB1_FULL_47_13]